MVKLKECKNCFPILPTTNMADKEAPAAFAQAMAMLQLEQQAAVMEKMNSVCLQRCVTTTSDGKLGDKQRRCLDACTTSFLETFQVAAETFLTIASKKSPEE